MLDPLAVSVYIDAHPGDEILAVASRAARTGHRYFLFNGYLIPSTRHDYFRDYERNCPFVGFWYLSDLDRHHEMRQESRETTTTKIDTRGSNR
jgi:hypothetical protein